SGDTANLALMGRPDLGSTVTKIGIWALTEYERIAFLDADTLVLDSIDALLDIPPLGSEQQQANDIAIGQDIRPNGGMRNEGLLAAAPDLGWPDCFNSGVFVAKPSKTTHAQLLDLLASQGSFDGRVLNFVSLLALHLSLRYCGIPCTLQDNAMQTLLHAPAQRLHCPFLAPGNIDEWQTSPELVSNQS
ncbi:glycogenin glucosyltransferase, partial [Coemansia guatemalensis]